MTHRNNGRIVTSSLTETDREMKTLDYSPMSKKESPDVLICACDSIYPKDKRGRLVVGQFLMSANSHSTGCEVEVWVTAEGMEPRMIRQTTYWYSSNYTFNKSHADYGVWDDVLLLTYDRMKLAIAEHRAYREAEAMVRDAEEMDSYDKKKSAYEKAFASS